jgi:hypothetical protein
MSITTDLTKVHLQRSQLWTGEMKESLKDRLEGEGYVRWIADPDGDTMNIPSVGDATIRDYSEDSDVQYSSLDTGNFQFSITEYKQSGLYITRKARQDSAYAAELEASFVPKMNRAHGEVLESDIWGLAAAGGGIGGAGQTATSQELINGAAHRMVASGGSNAARTLALTDFTKIVYGAQKAHLPGNLVGFVDPSVEHALNNLQTGALEVSNNPRFEGIVETGFGKDMRFVRNVFGIDIYVNNYLPHAGASAGVAESIDDGAVRTTSAANSVTNVFFSVGGEQDLTPFIGAWRQMPIVDSEWNKDKQREEYVVTSRYGLKLYRPENLFTILSDKVI